MLGLIAPLPESRLWDIISPHLLPNADCRLFISPSLDVDLSTVFCLRLDWQMFLRLPRPTTLQYMYIGQGSACGFRPCEGCPRISECILHLDALLETTKESAFQHQAFTAYSTGQQGNLDNGLSYNSIRPNPM